MSDGQTEELAEVCRCLRARASDYFLTYRHAGPVHTYHAIMLGRFDKQSCVQLQDMIRWAKRECVDVIPALRRAFSDGPRIKITHYLKPGSRAIASEHVAMVRAK